MSTLLQRAAIKTDGSMSAHLERKVLAVRAELDSVATELSRKRDSKPGPKPALTAVRRAQEHLDRALAAVRTAEPTIDEVIHG